jgi:predicted GH43/DUF377 family glycosyl hydrolase
MVNVKKEGIILEKTALDFEHNGVLNPAAIREGDFVHLFYRAVSEGNHSSIGYCKLNGPLQVENRMDKPILVPEFDYECKGIEDPRLVKIEDLYYLTYTAFDGINALGCLATSTDLIHFEKRGILAPQLTHEEFINLVKTNPFVDFERYGYNLEEGIHTKDGIKMLVWDKNIIFFPRKIGGKVQFVATADPLHDLTPAFWKNYFLNIHESQLFLPKYDHELSYIGGGCPPIETEFGWLLIYHGVKNSLEGNVYSACAALLDLDNPRKEIARLPYPLFVPKYEWELTGEVNNVCFPTGAVVFEDTLYIYYGAADKLIACASMSLSELIQELLANK